MRLGHQEWSEWNLLGPDLVGITIRTFERLDLVPVSVDSAWDVEAQS